MKRFDDLNSIIELKSVAQKQADIERKIGKLNLKRYGIIIILLSILVLLLPASLIASLSFINSLSLVFISMAVYKNSLYTCMMSLDRLKRTYLKYIFASLKNSSNTKDDRFTNYLYEEPLIDANDIEIIPKNIKIGEDLSSKNIVPIFKEGKYVIIKSRMNPIFIRVIEDEEKTDCLLMEPIDSDIDILMEEVFEYKEYIDALKLQKKF